MTEPFLEFIICKKCGRDFRESPTSPNSGLCPRCLEIRLELAEGVCRNCIEEDGNDWSTMKLGLKYEAWRAFLVPDPLVELEKL